MYVYTTYMNFMSLLFDGIDVSKINNDLKIITIGM